MGRIVVLAAVTIAGYVTVALALTERAFNPELMAFAAAPAPPQTQAAPVSATGAWDIVINVPDAPLSLYAEWTQKENVVDGSVFDANDEMKVSGTMEGSTLRINLYISGVVIRLTGEVKGDTITGKAAHASAGQVDWTATRAKPQ